MRNKSYLFIVLLGATISVLFTSCKGEDRRLDYKDTEGVNSKIYTKMKNVYLWYDEIPDSTKLNPYANPDVYFYTLLSSKEKKNGYYYSWIERKKVTTKSIDESSSYGFEFMNYTTDSTRFVRVLYVLPQSPASDAGLKRGDWIIAFNGQKITSTNYTQLYTGSGVKLTLGTFTGNANNPFVESGSLSITTSRPVTDNPILVKEVLTGNSGSKIGYLMYNRFSTGINDNADDFTYENELRQAFASFKSQNVNDFILDLRYNPGGYISTSQLLSTMLAPGSALGKAFCVAKFNNKTTPAQYTYTFDSNLIGSGANLNLPRLYVLVTNHTASASEALINGLKPFMNVTLIGATTEGKNLGSQAYESNEYDWIIHPIVCKLYNSEDKSDYASGFKPDVELDELADYKTLKELGSTDEVMLKKALALINGASVTKTARTKSISLELKAEQSSLDRKKTNGAWLAPVKR